MARQMFDPVRRSAKRNRARSKGGDRFLHRRAMEDCVERLALLPRPERALILGWEDASEIASIANSVAVTELDSLEPRSADLIMAIGVIDRADDPALAAFMLRHALKPGGRLLGAEIGGNSLPRMRRAFLEAERVRGHAVQRFHPLPDGPSLSALLADAGLQAAVVDVDRVSASYSGLPRLIDDLRGMGCTASLADPTAPLNRTIYAEACLNFMGGEAKAVETFEILHFSALAPIEV